MASDDGTDVKLGFLEEVDCRLLRSHFFPSKVGGKPSWLSLNPIPDPTELQCTKCNDVFRFLMQVYAPLQQKEDTFHRTIFIFLCQNPLCKSFKILRSQLPLENEFYSSTPPSEDIVEEDFSMDHPCAEKFHHLCLMCGIKGSKKCSRCKAANYCSKSHQVIDWKSGHKKECADLLSKSKENNTSDISIEVQILISRLQNLECETTQLFKEFELVTEDEELPEDLNNSKSEAERLEEYRELVSLPGMDTDSKQFTLEELEKSATAESEDDKVYLRFKERIKAEPTQVLRYSRLGSPLWVSAYDKPAAEDIPKCQCGAERVFEFQVMPQLLNHLDLDRLGSSVDWGTLAVYTCRHSCTIGNSYVEEFVWRQDFHNPQQ